MLRNKKPIEKICSSFTILGIWFKTTYQTFKSALACCTWHQAKKKVLHLHIPKWANPDFSVGLAGPDFTGLSTENQLNSGLRGTSVKQGKSNQSSNTTGYYKVWDLLDMQYSQKAILGL